MKETVIEVAGAGQVHGAIEHVYDELQAALAHETFEKVLKEKVTAALAKAHEEYFDRQAGPDGEWAPLSPVTVARKGFDTILIEHGNMRASLVFGGSDHIEDVSEAGLTWGTDDPKAALHQAGTGTMPARPFVGVTDSLVDQIAEIIADEAVAVLLRPAP